MYTNICDIKIKFQHFESTASISAQGNKKQNKMKTTNQKKKKTPSQYKGIYAILLWWLNFQR